MTKKTLFGSLYAIVSIGYITAILRNLGFSYISIEEQY